MENWNPTVWYLHSFEWELGYGFVPPPQGRVLGGGTFLPWLSWAHFLYFLNPWGKTSPGGTISYRGVTMVKVWLPQKTVKFYHSAAFQKFKFQNFLQPWWRYATTEKVKLGHAVDTKKLWIMIEIRLSENHQIGLILLLLTVFPSPWLKKFLKFDIL